MSRKFFCTSFILVLLSVTFTCLSREFFISWYEKVFPLILIIGVLHHDMQNHKALLLRWPSLDCQRGQRLFCLLLSNGSRIQLSHLASLDALGIHFYCWAEMGTQVPHLAFI